MQQTTPPPAHVDGFLPHGACYLWNPELLWTHVGTDLLIGASYVAISVTLAYLVHRLRRDVPFSTVFVAFGLFIIACGMTHFMEIWTLWQPVYWTSAAVKVVTAAASLSTAVALPFVVPQVQRTIHDAKLAEERRLAAERAAAEREGYELLRAVIQSTSDAVFIKDAEGRYKLVNQATARTFGRPVDEVLGRDDFALLPADTARALRRIDGEVMATGADHVVEERITVDGVERVFLSTKTAQRDATGAVVGLVGVSRDITERKRHEEAIERANEELARASAEADAANRAKSEFLAVMSHELRTPLNAVVGYTDLLSMGVAGPVSERQGEQLGRIKRSATHLVGLIDQILSFARIEAGMADVRLARVSVRDVTREAAALLEPIASSKGLRLEVETPDRDVQLFTDSGKLRQILVNVLSNAVKFTDAGTVALRSQLECGRVAFHIDDTGIGIAPEHLDRIFDPFWQVQQGTKRQAGGTGLGLSVVRELAGLLGGHVEVSSTVGVGSRFTFRVPLTAPVRCEAAESEVAAV